MDITAIPTALARDDRLDAGRSALAALAGAIPEAARPWLRGEWLGHPVHPALTDLPIGFWTAASVLDVVGGRRAAPAATWMVGLGLAFVPPTVAAGLTDWEDLPAAKQRVGVVHAAANLAATGLYGLSFAARRRGQRGRGALFALAGMGVATVGGLLGGHLAFGSDADAVDLRTEEPQLWDAERREPTWVRAGA